MGREAKATAAARAEGRELVAKVTIRDGETRVEYQPDDPQTAARVLLGGLNAVLTKLQAKPAPLEVAKPGAGNGKPAPVILKPSAAARLQIERTRRRGS